MANDSSDSGLMDTLGLDKLKDTFSEYASGMGDKLIQSATDKLNGLSEGSGGAAGEAAEEGAEELAEGESPAKAALSAATTGAKEKAKDVFSGGGGGSGGSGKFKFANFVETFDVGMPVDAVYNAWTSYDQWPDFMKKAEHAEFDEEEGTAEIKGQVFWSHRTWEATIKQQVPDDHIVWTSTGEKGHLDGAVSFHSLGDRLTRMVIVVEYHPQGFVEKTGNIWRAVGRRLRLEVKHFIRHVMTEVILDPDSVEGWRGEIRDEEIVRTHEEVVEAEQEEAEQEEAGQEETDEPAEDEQLDDEAEEPAEEEPAQDEEPADEEPAEEDEPIEDEPEQDEEPVDEEPAEDEEPVDEEPAEDEISEEEEESR